VSIGFLTLWLYTIGVSLSQVTPVLVAMFVVIGSCDLIRFKYPEFNKLYVQAVGFLMREKEVKTFNGVIWYLLGINYSIFTVLKGYLIVGGVIIIMGKILLRPPLVERMDT